MGGGRKGRGFPGFFDEGVNRWQGALKGIEGFFISRAAITDGVRDVPTHQIILRAEFADEIRFGGGTGKQGFDVRPVPLGHGKDVSGLLDQFPGEGLAAEPAEIHLFLLQNIHGMLAGSLPGGSTDARAFNRIIVRVFHEGTEETFCHGTAADVSGADKKDVFQGKDLCRRVGPGRERQASAEGGDV